MRLRFIIFNGDYYGRQTRSERIRCQIQAERIGQMLGLRVSSICAYYICACRDDFAIVNVEHFHRGILLGNALHDYNDLKSKTNN